MIASTHVEVPAPFPAIVGTATICTSRIVAVNGGGAVEIQIKSGDQLLATVTNPT